MKPADAKPPHMDHDTFRSLGHQAIDWIADYWQRLADRPVAPPVEPGSIRAQLPTAPPECGEDFPVLLSDLERIVLPGLLHWQHPRFFGYFPANASGPAVLAELLSAGLGIQGMNWNTSPACTEIEQQMLDWFVHLLGLPEHLRGGGVIQDTASSALLVALLTALHQASAGRTRDHGTGGCGYRVYLTAETHSAARKAAVITGLGLRAMCEVATDADGAMDAADLERHLRADRAAGLTPLMVVATRGTTSHLSFDPLEDIGPVCRRHGVWLHVDAAYAGVAAVCDELRWVNDGVRYADSYCTNPHKWLLTNFDCDLLWVAHPEVLVSALSVLPEYLRNSASESGRVTDFRHWQVPLGRRFRALKLWSVLHWYGAEGLRAHIRTGVRHAQLFADLVGADDRFTLVTPPALGLVTFRQTGTDEENRNLLQAINTEGTTFLTHSEKNGTFFLRFAAGGTLTEDHHVREAWRAVQNAIPRAPHLAGGSADALPE
ncbi:pyridoxal-dependent decarboxylase [Streptomyces noursei]|uniref:pyridoxal-dependent decarboxylase n=1 Tax=Streptomyces noursei TaxID=1971 RepID=UPI001F47883C|nr:pyridoxal-dependent decarboxylase [Streptomyces noursei]MCE4946778.1 pyridoxal-dependent decarboxylase [Streptomyces noursei]